MTDDTRVKGTLGRPGPFLAEITNHLDASFMGRLEVALIKGMPSRINKQGNTHTVSYMSPFFGSTSIRYEGNNSSSFNDVQKSYGMWMVPPDVGSLVMVIFIDGDPNQGYWIGCVPDQFQNHMVPGIAASSNTAVTREQQQRYGTDYLPVAEFHKGSQLLTNSNVGKISKPVHPFADRLLAQGLLLDTIRGVTSSSARREIPSGVFGISTPGPLDTSHGAPMGKIGYEGSNRSPVSRLGGSTFVMDDGDINGHNELIRIRTRTGHQILMHNSEDLIYIANSKGTAWIEMTSAGKLDIYAEDSVSIHTKSDFNFRADRDINLEAGRNINIAATGSLNINAAENYNLMVSQDGKIQFNGAYNHTVNDEYKLTVSSNYYVKSDGNINLKSTGNNNFTAGASTNIKSSKNHFETAGEIHMNGPAAATAIAPAAEVPQSLPLFSLPNTDPGEGWSGNQYKADNILSIMQRVPTHEPWPQHENTSPSKFSSTNTDAISGSANDPLPPPNGDQPADWASDIDFIDEVTTVAKQLNCNYIDLLACMAFETGRTFDPAKRNPRSSATGLIQFMASTAKSLGTTTAYLAGLTRTQQMSWVEKYFKNSRLVLVPAPALEDLYMAILWPAAVGQPNSYVIFKSGTAEYQVNAGLDIGKKGYVTKEDAASKVRQQILYVQQQIANIEQIGT